MKSLAFCLPFIVALVALQVFVAGCSKSSPAPTVGGFRQVSFDAALAAAKSEGKPVFVDFTADWCPPCQKLKKETFQDARVQEWLSKNVVAVMIDVDAKENEATAKKYRVGAIPHLALIGADGTIIKESKGYMDADKFMQNYGTLK